ncbi:MAG: hypothetical protein A4E73_02326 [Syntrophaceae bacterium PtaU1.Bin231]|nr:MAG: hypothetical protein A4E73_02326 [Syntrophaceae bacterium PtaU1.Bin231]
MSGNKGHIFFRGLLVLFGLAAVTGCFGRTGPSPAVERYALRYEPPAATGNAAAGTIRVERFSAARPFGDVSVVFGTDAFRLDTYRNRRWAASPADMTADLLIRDLRAAGCFSAVLPPQSLEEAGYSIEGRLEEFLESVEPGGRSARLSLTLTLVDLKERNPVQRVVMQKGYRFAKALEGEGTSALAGAMSRAAEAFSRQAVADICAAVPVRP